MTIEGDITDEETGKPIPGVRLRSISSYGMRTTDARGHYRFEGIDPAYGLNCNVRVPGQPYFSLMQGLRVGPVKSLDPIRKDLKLTRGILGYWSSLRSDNRQAGLGQDLLHAVSNEQTRP